MHEKPSWLRAMDRARRAASLGACEATAIWRLRLRRRRLADGYLAGIGFGITALVAIPCAEQLWRCAWGGRK